MTEFTVQCSSCGENVPETEAEFVGSVGVHGRPRDVFCPGCSDS